MSAPAGPGSDGLLDKLLQARPEHALARLFLPQAERDATLAFEAVVFELEQALWQAREPQAAALKLQWWAEEWTRLADGAARHPLSQRLPSPRSAAPLHEAAGAWGEAALSLLDDASAADFAAQQALLQRFYAPLAAIEAALFGRGRDTGSLRARAFLLRELRRLSAGHDAHRLVLPLHLLARHQLVRDALGEASAAREAALRDQLAELASAWPTAVTADAVLPLRLRARLDAALIRRALAAAAPSRVLREDRGLSLSAPWLAWREARRRP